MPALAPRAVNLLNIGLMLGSLLLALLLPFELFLFSWAVLGPAHYLTEISWLHDRRYFSKRAADPWILLAFCLAILLGTATVAGDHAIDGFLRWNPELIFGAFALAGVFAFVESMPGRVAGAIATMLVALKIHGSLASIFLFSLYVPTLIHVCLFTFCFLLAGARKTSAAFGMTSVAVFVLCSLAAVVSSRVPQLLGVSDYARSTYPFDSIVAIVTYHLGLAEPTGGAARTAFFPFATRDEIFTTPAAIATARFVAFAYTYHYLNWFSKTSVIRWHEIPRARAWSIVVLWIASVALYAIDFKAGLAVLFGLSLAHVLLEFPLNHRTFAQLAVSVFRPPA